MHGCDDTSILLVNAEVDSMGVVDGGLVVDGTSPHKAATDTIHEEHRQECDGREKRKRELEFLEKGGNPLEYELGNAASVSVQSTSFVDHKPYNLVDSEAKYNLPNTASPSGDSVESSGRPRAPNSGNNIVLIDGNHSSRENGESAVGLPGKAYKRRNRSRQNRNGGRPTSNNPNPRHGNNGSSLLAQRSSRDVKGFVTDGGHQNVSLDSNLKITEHKTVRETLLREGDRQQSGEVESLRSAKSTHGMIADASTDTELEACIPKNHINKFKQGSPSAVEAPSQLDSGGTDAKQAAEELICVAVKHQPSDTAIEFDNQPSSLQMNGKNEDMDTNDGHASTSMIKGSDLVSSTRTNRKAFGDNDVHICAGVKSAASNGEIENQSIASKELHVSETENDKSVDKEKHSDRLDTNQSPLEKGFVSRPEEKLKLSLSASGNRGVDYVIIKGSEASISTGLVSGRKPMNSVCENPDLQSQAVPPLSEKDITSSELKVTNKIDEDSILNEAQIIQVKRKRIAGLSVSSPPTEILQRAHWDYVLEEIAWLAIDFAQERIWKMAAASQISYRAIRASCLKKQEFNSSMEVKKVAHNLARAVMEFWLSVDLKHEKTEELEMQPKKNGSLSVRAYVVRFMKYNRANNLQDHVEVPLTPDRISDYRNFDNSGDSDFAEEKLFYMVSPGVMQAYRKSIETHVGHSKEIGCIESEVETSACDTATAYESEGTVYDDDEGETSTYNTSEAFEYNKSSRIAQLKRKRTTYADSAENKFTSQQSSLAFKRPGSNLNVSIPTKRVRTASRRVIIKPDASSGDTNSYQDDESTLHGALLYPNSLEVESTEDFEKQLPLDSTEVTTISKKRKKPKHLSADDEGHWQVDSTFHNDQFERDHFKKRSDGHHLESNSNTGLLGQPMKKLKIVRQSHNSSFNKMPPAASLPSPAASQMSNMSIPNKFIKNFSGRDFMKKDKTLRSSHRQLSSGSPWSDFEDQALVVLVHDLGPNWELICDALNSLLYFKCVFRKAKECKERHSALMNRNSGEGGESAEDSGTSQAYPATLPGIPKGTARQLYQRLQGHNEYNTLKSHFGKIITIMQKQHSRRAPQDQNRIQPHNSHDSALSQVFPNNLNGGPVLTPLDLCDANPTGPELLPLGHQGPNPSGMAIASQGSDPAIQGSPNPMNGNKFSASPVRPNSSTSHQAPRLPPLSLEEQQRLQMYSRLISDGNTLSPSVSSPRTQPGTDRGVRVHPSGNGVGIVASGSNRNFQGMSSPSTVNSSLGPNGHGSLVLRPREPLHLMRPRLGPEHQRQIVISEHQMPGSSQGGPRFRGLSTLTNRASPPAHSISTVPPHQPRVQGPQSPGSSAQRQAYGIRLAKERQLQQHFQHQQRQYAASNSLAPNAQPQAQQPQTSSPVPPPSPLTAGGSVNSMPQHSQKQIAPNRVIIRGNVPAGSRLGGQGGKQQQSQQQLLSPQANRQHSQQPPLQTQQQGSKVAKAGGHAMHQNITALNGGVSTNQRPVNQNQAAIRWVAKPNNSLVNPAPSATSQSRDPNAAVDAVTPLPQTPMSLQAGAHQLHAQEQLIESNAVNSANNLRPPASNLGPQGHSHEPTLGPTNGSPLLLQSGSDDLCGILDDPLE